MTTTPPTGPPSFEEQLLQKSIESAELIAAELPRYGIVRDRLSIQPDSPLHPEAWPIIVLPEGEPMTMQQLVARIQNLINNKQIDEALRAQLQQTWANWRGLIGPEIAFYILHFQEDILRDLGIDPFTFTGTPDEKIDKIDELIARAQSHRESGLGLGTEEQQAYRGWFESLIATLSTERTELMEQIDYERYARRSIPKLMEALAERYGRELGIDFSALNATASAGGGMVSSVSCGIALQVIQTMSLRHEFDEWLRIDLEAIEPTQEETELNRAMIPWVIPHEIAHLVSDAKDSKPLKEALAAHEDKVTAISGEHIPDDFLRLTLEECFTDGLGTNLVQHLGTNEHGMDSARNAEAHIIGYIRSTGKILGYIEERERTNNDSVETVTNYRLLLLRTFGTAQMIEEYAKGARVAGIYLSDLSSQIVRLRMEFARLNAKEVATPMTIDEQDQVIEMCRDMFEKGQTADLSPIIPGY